MTVALDDWREDQRWTTGVCEHGVRWWGSPLEDCTDCQDADYERTCAMWRDKRDPWRHAPLAGTCELCGREDLLDGGLCPRCGDDPAGDDPDLELPVRDLEPEDEGPF